AMVLAGDVGGTQTLLAVFDTAAMTIVRETTLPSRELESLESAVEAFLLGAPRIKVDGGCTGVAGPVMDGRCVATNLPWVVDERHLAAAPGAPVKLIHDLQATAPPGPTPPPGTF